MLYLPQDERLLQNEIGDAEDVQPEDELDIETRACLHALYPDDYPAVDPLVDDVTLAHLLSGMSEYQPDRSLTRTFQVPVNDPNFPVFNQPFLHFNPYTTFTFDESLAVPSPPSSGLTSDSLNLDLQLASHLPMYICPSDTIPSDSSLPPTAASVEVSASPPDTIQSLLTLSSQPTATVAPAAEPERRLNSRGRPYCIMNGCTKIALSAACTNRMCKPHCESVGSCTTTSHKGRVVDPTVARNGSTSNNSDTPSSLSQPAPTTPLGPSSAGNGASLSTSTPGKDYRAAMSPLHAENWNKRKEMQQKAIDNKARQIDNQKRFNQQVIIYGWTKVNKFSLFMQNWAN